MSYHGYIVGFVNSYPKFHFVAKSVKDEVSIISEFGNNSVIFPSPNILQGLWKVPVVQSDLKEKGKGLLTLLNLPILVQFF